MVLFLDHYRGHNGGQSAREKCNNTVQRCALLFILDTLEHVQNQQRWIISDSDFVRFSYVSVATIEVAPRVRTVTPVFTSAGRNVFFHSLNDRDDSWYKPTMGMPSSKDQQPSLVDRKLTDAHWERPTRAACQIHRTIRLAITTCQIFLALIVHMNPCSTNRKQNRNASGSGVGCLFVCLFCPRIVMSWKPGRSERKSRK